MKSDTFEWVAGLLEGEGYFGLRRRGSSVLIQLGMVDEDVVERARTALGAGTIKRRKLASGKTCFTLSILRQSVVEDIMRRLLPLMGERRRARIEHCLAERAKCPRPKGEWTHCKRGHELSGDNLRIVSEGKYRKRRCRTCGNLRQQKHRSAAAA